jgi:DNA-binding LacI/PurR family transcriptional regulator
MAAERNANLICFPGKPLRSPLAFEAQSNILYDLVSSRAVDGLVIWASGLPLFVEPQAVAAFCQGLRARGVQPPKGPLPMVTVGIPVDGLPGVRVDNYGGMRVVIEHLIDVHARRRFAFVRGPDVHQEAAVRYRAFLDVLEARGLPLIPELVFSGNFKESGGVYAIEKLIDEDRATFDALVAASDNMAIGAMKALQSRGIRVPEDIAVHGGNLIPWNDGS